MLSLIGTIFLLVQAVAQGSSTLKLVSLIIYGVSMTGLYTASTLYHCVNTTVSGRIALRKYDHTSIYFLIAGTYTPICLTALKRALGYTLMSIIWTLTVAGLFMSLFWINCPRALTATIYIAMGWLALVAVYPLWLALGPHGLFWLSWAASCIRWAECPMPSSGRVGTIHDSAATRFFMCSSCWDLPLILC